MMELDLTGPAPQPQTLAEAQEVIDVLWELVQRMQQLQATVEALQSKIAVLEDQHTIDSRSSSRPPSSDTPEQRLKRRKKPRSSKSQGGQPGHPKHERALVDAKDVNQTYKFYPDGQCSCGQAHHINEQPTVRHQVVDLPQVRFEVIEYQLYSAHCSVCDQTTTAELPQWVPRGQMGPGLIAWIGVLAGQFHLSMRQIQAFLHEQWQLRFSVGAISQAQGKMNAWLGPVYRDLGEHVRQADVAHADETTHWRNTERRWLWCLATPLVSYFVTHFSRGKAAAMELLGSFSGVLVTDHFSGYNDYTRERRQLCWAHLVRRFERIARRVGEAGEVGQRLVLLAYSVFRTRHRWERGQLTLYQYQRRMQRLRRSLRETLARGCALNTSTRTVNQCKHVLKDEALYWTFLRDARIPLTNNCAERALRGYVIWRKLSFACQSHQGEQFRPMILSIVETAKRLQISTHRLLRAICTQGLRGEPITVRLPLPDPGGIRKLTQ